MLCLKHAYTETQTDRQTDRQTDISNIIYWMDGWITPSVYLSTKPNHDWSSNMTEILLKVFLMAGQGSGLWMSHFKKL